MSTNAPPGADQDGRAPWYDDEIELPEREYDPEDEAFFANEND